MSVDRVIKFELGKLNAHLPENRISLKDALALPKPSIRARDGRTHFFKREELETLSKLLPEADWDKLQLPILIALEPKLGRGTARISGESEVKVAGKILNKQATEELLIYRPEVAILRRKLPTTTQYLFM